MKIQWFTYLIYGLFIASCQVESNNTLDINGVLLDMDGKPLSGFNIDQKRGGTVFHTFKTDNKGQFNGHFSWNSDEALVWSLSISDTIGYKAVNYLESTNPYVPHAAKIAVVDTLRMDVLKPITLHIKTNRSDIRSLQVSVSGGNYSVYSLAYSHISKPQKRVFLNTYKLSSTPQLDTTIVIQAYSKAGFDITSTLYFKNDPLVISKSMEVLNYAKRDTVFLFEF